MARACRVLLLLLFLLAGTTVLAGDRFLLERGAPVSTNGQILAALGPEEQTGVRHLFFLSDGQVQPCHLTAAGFADGSPFGENIGLVLPLPEDPDGLSLLTIGRGGLDWQLWRDREGQWLSVKSGSFAGPVSAAAAGRFGPEGAGLFLQVDSGQLAYWQLSEADLIPIWQSPQPWPSRFTLVRSGDLNGDGMTEVMAADAKGALTVLRWQNGTWAGIWTLPSWGQILGLDLAQADDLPGLEIAIVTSQRRLFLIGANASSYAIRAKLNTSFVASQVGLIPADGGGLILADASGTLSHLVPDANGGSWLVEAQLNTDERLSFLGGLGPRVVLAGTSLGALRLIQPIPLSQVTVFSDGQEVKNSGLFWQDGEFYFSAEFLGRVLKLTGKWDEKKAQLSLSAGKVSATMTANRKEVSANGRPWTLGRSLIVANKIPYVPAELLRAVFLVNVTWDPEAGWLILTSAAG